MTDLAKPVVTILLAESLGIVRAGLKALLGGESGVTVVAETGDGTSLVDLVARLRPDVLVLEPGLSGLSPHQLLADVKTVYPQLKVLILGGARDESTVATLLEAGADGGILKSDRPEEFLRAIPAVAAGELAVSSAVTRWLLARQGGHEPLQTPDSLTEREREVMHFLTAGLSNKEIAQKLYLSVRTVEVHLRNVYAKLGVKSRLEAVAQAVYHDRPGPSNRPG